MASTVATLQKTLYFSGFLDSELWVVDKFELQGRKDRFR